MFGKGLKTDEGQPTNYKSQECMELIRAAEVCSALQPSELPWKSWMPRAEKVGAKPSGAVSHCWKVGRPVPEPV